MSETTLSSMHDARDAEDKRLLEAKEHTQLLENSVYLVEEVGGDPRARPSGGGRSGSERLPPGERQLSVFRTWDFDAVVIVLFDDSFEVWRAARLPAAAPYASTHARHSMCAAIG